MKIKDTIYREDAIKEIKEYILKENEVISEHPDDIFKYNSGLLTAIQAVHDLPSVNRPQGEWIYGEHNVAMCDGYRCNRCDFFVPWDYEHKFIDFINDYHFCPSCGARMKGEVNENQSIHKKR